MSSLTRWQSRQISRNRFTVQSESPCQTRYRNPFEWLFQRMFSNPETLSPEERKIQHEVRMAKQEKDAAKRKKQLSKRRKTA